MLHVWSRESLYVIFELLIKNMWQWKSEIIIEIQSFRSKNLARLVTLWNVREYSHYVKSSYGVKYYL
jgi:hypothetical protein